MRRAEPEQPLNVALRTFAATLGTLPLALYAAACVARFAPMSADARYALAFTLVVPIWVAAMCVAFLARSGGRALTLALALAAGLAGLVYGLPHP